MRSSVNVLPVLLCVVLLGSCREDRPSYVPGTNEMEDLLYDYHVVHSLARLSKDSAEVLSEAYSEAVLRKYGLTQEEFDSSLVWYGRHTSELADIYKNLDKRMKGEIALLGELVDSDESFSALPTSGDTANIWPGKSHYILSSPGLQNRLSFSIADDTLFLPKDKFEWHFNVHFVLPSGGRDAVVSMTLRYRDGSTQTRTMRMHSEKEFTFNMQANDKQPASVEGFLLMNSGWAEQQKLLIVTQPTLVRTHTGKPKPVSTAAGDSLRSDSVATDSMAVDSTASLSDTSRVQAPVAPHARPTPVGKKQRRR